MAAALVKRQIDKLDNFISIRTFAANMLINKLKKFEKFLILPKISKKIKNSWFTFPIVVKKNAKFRRKDLVNYLSKNNIANRPIIAGNIAEQPFLKKFKFKKTRLRNSELVMHDGFFIGLNHKLNKKKIDYISKTFENFFKNL